jgi:hypothetical protein
MRSPQSIPRARIPPIAPPAIAPALEEGVAVVVTVAVARGVVGAGVAFVGTNTLDVRNSC